MTQKLIFCFFALVMAGAANAEPPKACKKSFIELQNRNKTELKAERTISVTAETDLKKLRRVEAQAVSDYQTYIMQEIPEWGLEVTSRQYVSKERKETMGYRVEVNGGDEAIGVFYYRLDVGMEDVVDQLLYYVWHNQSPVREWVCEGF